MRLPHPFAWLSDGEQACAFVVLAVLSVALMVILQILSAPLRTTEAPRGIVSFELAGELPKARGILQSWCERQRVYAGLNLGLDYLFLATYPVSISLGCVLVSRGVASFAHGLVIVGVILAWAQFAALVLDAAENVVLIQLLLGSERELWPPLARWCAIPKFCIAVVGLAYVGLGVLGIFVVWVWRMFTAAQS